MPKKRATVVVTVGWGMIRALPAKAYFDSVSNSEVYG
jgi:hypothetical protein